MAARRAVCCFKHSSRALRFSYLSHESYFRVNPWPSVTSIRQRGAEQDFENIKRKIYTGALYQKRWCGCKIFRHNRFEFYKYTEDVKYAGQFSRKPREPPAEHLVSLNGRKQPHFAPRTRHSSEEFSTGLKCFRVTFINRILRFCTS